ncbi:nose resistant to fluoxetine protein 6-like [Camponotus floridanus]|uniref:nose resistant to fluoxetine protein 6-like n=1 Tax=Camponotus floridanus TaxID=104421 RepID=UPI000DC6688B|nr:nose resistant to fluoxetine protein 6-like [Camponotus floridanus]
MFKQTVLISVSTLLLRVSSSFADPSHSGSEQWTSNEKNSLDRTNNLSSILNGGGYNNEQCFANTELLNPVNLPLLPIIFAQSEDLPNGKCKEDAQRFLRELQNGTLWAVQMFDSSSKYPDGVLYGHTRHLGNFDECYNLQIDAGEVENKMAGRYCLVDLEYKRKDAPISYEPTMDYNPNESFWEAIEERGNIHRVRRYLLQLAICVPSSCSAKDIETALKRPLEKIGANKNININTAVQINYCQTIEEAPKFTLPAIIYCIVLLSLLIIIFVSTLYETELSSGNTSTVRNALLCFSLRRNFKSVLQINYSNPGLDTIHFIRFFLALIVLNGHRVIQYYANPTVNVIDFERLFAFPPIAFYLNGKVVIDVFFALGALLVTYHMLGDLDRRKQLNFFSDVITRYFRLTPSYAVIIFFHAWILPLLGSGPLWKHEIVQESTECSTNWWANLLYINNYVKPTEMCMFQTWYLSVDFQLFILSQFVIYAFWCMPRKIGYSFLGILTIISCAIPFLITYLYRVPPVFVFTLRVQHFSEAPFFASNYIQTYMRFIAYLVGITGGAILHDHRGIKRQISTFWSHVLVVILPLTMAVTFQLWAHRFFMPHFEWSSLEGGFCSFYQKLLFSICICSIIVVLSIDSRLTFYHKFLTPSWAQILAKLTYGVYLVSDIFHIYNNGRRRNPRMFSIYDVIWDSIPDTVSSFLIALVLTLCVEIPFRKLSQIFLPSKKAVTK